MIKGILNIYKPAGPTSHDIVDEIRKILAPLSPAANGVLRRKRLRIGHAGTLDPFAQGVLIVLIGSATKMQSKFMAMDKTYVATLRLGKVSDTYDKTGNIETNPSVETSPPMRSACPPRQAWRCRRVGGLVSHINSVLKQFIGEIQQTPPIYSAIKIKGKKAYEMARKGQKPKLKPRKIKIYNIKLLKYKWPYLEIEVRCGKGTYIRSLGHDIGQKLDCGAYLEKLIRTKIGKFTIDNSVEPAKLNISNWQNYLICVQ